MGERGRSIWKGLGSTIPFSRLQHVLAFNIGRRRLLLHREVSWYSFSNTQNLSNSYCSILVAILLFHRLRAYFSDYDVNVLWHHVYVSSCNLSSSKIPTNPGLHLRSKLSTLLFSVAGFARKNIASSCLPLKHYEAARCFTIQSLIRYA